MQTGKEVLFLEDSRILELYWRRSEAAIGETEGKYGPYCYSIAKNILNSQECANDTWPDFRGSYGRDEGLARCGESCEYAPIPLNWKPISEYPQE